jgi:peptidoglycan/xylan/chitin deacetylase (PgdA/CDA1 family)
MIRKIKLNILVMVLCFAYGYAESPKLAVLTFDDSIKSHFTVVRPILKKLNFGATFFITEGWDFKTNKDHYMTWQQIKQLHEDGFEIGNHTKDHMGVTLKSLPRLKEQIDAIALQCQKIEVPKPVSFAYPGNRYELGAFEILKASGILLARRGNYPKKPKLNNIGYVYDPKKDHPYLIPSSGIAIPSWELEDFKAALVTNHESEIPILQFHGVPDTPHPWVNTDKDKFIEFMNYLKQENFKVIALRDVLRFQSNSQTVGNPLEIIHQREKLNVQKGGLK